jgi:hypothetical protein
MKHSRERFQNGSLRRVTRRTGPDVWLKFQHDGGVSVRDQGSLAAILGQEDSDGY